MSSPYLSIVLVGRNDNYGGDFKDRLSRCITWTHKKLTEYEIPSEIIFVNYNPLPAPPIEEFINWPLANQFVSIKIITVPSAIHSILIHDGTRKNFPIIEFLAKNVGIRRAKGEYILSTNADILFDNELFKGMQFSENNYYRANRFDSVIKENITTPEDAINYAKTGVNKIWLKGISREFEARRISWFYLKKIIFLQKLEIFTYNLIRWFNFLWSVKLHPKAEYTYHCNVSGDFMLMHRNKWFELKGYNENAFIALHVDALMVIQAATLGLKEKVLRFPIYHQEHARRYNATDENPEYREAYLFFQEEAQKMIKEKKAIIYNGPNWGLSNFDLMEQVI